MTLMRRPSLADSARSTSSLACRVCFTSTASLAAAGRGGVVWVCTSAAVWQVGQSGRVVRRHQLSPAQPHSRAQPQNQGALLTRVGHELTLDAATPRLRLGRRPAGSRTVM